MKAGCWMVTIALALMLPASALAQDATTTNALDCGRFAAEDPSFDLISKFCDFALNYRHQLPDFIAQQTTTFGGSHPSIVVTAQVTYRSGLEYYSHLALNGKPVTPKSPLPGNIRFTSAGEFGSLLVDLFTVQDAAEFKFRKTSTLRGVPVSIYEFHVPEKKNTFWTLRDGSGHEWKPEFRGEVWLEQQTGRPRREQIEAVHLPAQSLVDSAKTITDYAMTPVSEVGTFLLPVKSESTVCNRRPNSAASLALTYGDPTMASSDLPGACTSNVLVFHDYRKFAATARMVPAESEP